MPAIPFPTPAARRERDGVIAVCARRQGQDLLEELSERLRRLVPFAGAFWASTDPFTSLPTSPARVENISESCCAPFWDSEYLTEDFMRYADVGRAPVPVATLHDATGGRPRRSGRYARVNAAMGFDDELRAAFRTGGAVWGVMSLYRAEGEPPFSPAEQAAVAELGPVIADALRRGAVTEAGARGRAPVGPGLLVFDASGALRSVNDEAEHWLDALLPDPFASGRGLAALTVTTEILGVVRRARAIALGLDGGVARARMRGRDGGWVVVHGSCLRDASGEPDRVAVVIESAQAAEVAPVMVQAHGLTPREREIAEAVARGEATGEIAARLYLSPHTVRDHLKATFEKVGVGSRGELVAALFAAHSHPRMDRDIVEVRTTA